MKKENSISRRSFLKSSALAGALGAIGTGSTVGVLTSCGGGESANAIKPLKEPGTYYVPELPDLATDGKELKAGVIGCGGRGSGAAFNFLNAANGVTIVALQVGFALLHLGYGVVVTLLCFQLLLAGTAQKAETY